MLNQKYFSILTVVLTLIGTYFLPWWTIPFGIATLAFFTDISSIKSAALASAITGAIWMAWAGYQEFASINKVSTLTGQILGNASPSVVYILTGLCISLISGLAASCGKGIYEIVKDYNANK
jgi:hypothetical protein